MSRAADLKTQRAYQILPQDDARFTPQIGALVEMLHYARLTTLHDVAGLTAEQLDAVPAGFGNSVGMLLAHIAAVHRIYHGLSFEGWDVFEDEAYAPHRLALDLGAAAREHIRGHELGHYLAELEAASALTLDGLAARDDAWLASDLVMGGTVQMNHHWAWFHVMEDEVNHRGQIRLILNIVAPKVKAGEAT
ncbi:DinB family protein [Deinococcus sp. QL22]|uniref:DinB family protein n=1 Tax=Deinococcus sp. QL22 TaxID=2939437 RepID=UPI002017F14D|nr:DinB family protein [Deinococcus sp. QL22]UQN06391.1 DinB family protein [Deinococcus sp. QL22]